MNNTPATPMPLGMRIWRVFSFCMEYTKHALPFEQQIELLRQRGLSVPDTPHAVVMLGQVSYYRLSAYMKSFMQADRFSEGISFGDVEELYSFDKDLRRLLREPLECIEVYFRTRITYELAMRGGKFAHTHANLFTPSCNHADLLHRCEDDERHSTAQFVKHYRTKYSADGHLPIWMATELMSFGSLSTWYPLLRTDIQQQIAKPFEVDRSVLATWLECLCYVRNICAHHARLWNKELSIRPMVPKSKERWAYFARDNKRCYIVLLLLADMLQKTHPEHLWRNEAVSFLASCNPMQLTGMQVPHNWKQLLPWKTNEPVTFMEKPLIGI